MAPRHGVDYDVYLDVTALRLTLPVLKRHLAACETLIRPARSQRITVAALGDALLSHNGITFRPPKGVSPLAHALDLAQIDGRGLFIISGPWSPRSEQLRAIADLADIDPNAGTVQPRFCWKDDVVALPDARDSLRLLPRAALGLLPDHFVLPEIEAACVYITPQGAPACGSADASSASRLGQLLVSLRRRGFRNIVSNRVVVDYPLSADSAYRPLEATDPGPDAEDRLVADGWVSQSPALRLERLLSEAIKENRRRLLLDCRGMTPAHNGSAHAILGYLQGVASLDPDWHITVCVGEPAAEFHRLADRFPGFDYVFGRPRGKYLVAIHLSQPWSRLMLEELHSCAALVAFNILDTIAWDAIYPAPLDLDLVTRLAARFADGLLYLSEHSRRRFRFRFHPHDRMREAVTYLSTTPSDYGVDASRPVVQGRDILVVGNRLDHKDVERTADKLAQAFPFDPIVAFGTGVPSARTNVTTVPSGLLSDQEVSEMLENARVVVYPSFSEGFGIPVVQGLSLGKPVVARELPLWEEIRVYTGANGRLKTFHTDAELIDAVGSALMIDGPLDDDTSDSRPWIGWSDCARVLIDFADDLVEHFSFDHWQERDMALGAVH